MPRLQRISPFFTPPRTVAARALAAIALLMCAAAQAQAVRKCQAEGRTVFQSSPCAVEARVVASASSQAPAPKAATTDPSATAKKKTLADLLRERDSADRSRPQAREFQGEGANVLRSRMGAV